jgi:hypothetical protein
VPALKQNLSRRLTGRETAAVIATVAVLAGLGYLAYNFIAAKVFEARVSAALPKVCASLREQRRTLISALTAYKAHFGVYPPDAVLNRQPLVVDAVKNPLLYELVGVVYNPTNKMFAVGGLEAADAQYVKDFFHCDGFKNCAESAEQVQHFLPAFPTTVWRAVQLHDDPDVFALGFNVPYDESAPKITWEFDVSSWRYVSSTPTNNPGSFDLWIELRTKHQTITIGNWQAVE